MSEVKGTTENLNEINWFLLIQTITILTSVFMFVIFEYKLNFKRITFVKEMKKKFHSGKEVREEENIIKIIFFLNYHLFYPI